MQGFHLHLGYPGVVEKLGDLRFGDWGLGRGEALNAVGSVESAPGLDEAAESDVGREVSVGEKLLRHGASVVLLLKNPFLDAISVVGYSGGECHGVFHDFQRNWAQKI